jgi:hypothetical protein
MDEFTKAPQAGRQGTCLTVAAPLLTTLTAFLLGWVTALPAG